MQHGLQILLTHKSKVNPLEELLPAGVYRDRLFQFLEGWEVLHYHFVRSRYQSVLVLNSFEVLVESFLYAGEGLVFRFLTLVHEHQIVDDVDVGEVLNGFSHDVLLFRLSLLNVIESLFKS